MVYTISPNHLHPEQIRDIHLPASRLELSPVSLERLRHCHDFLSQKLAEPDSLYYGINTGFGSLCNVHISPQETANLQINLVRSHACGMGDPVPQELVRTMLFLKIQSLSYGYSGVHPDTVLRMADHFNHNLLPVVYELGSLGASGDLAPLAHLTLPLLGEGELWVNGQKQAAGPVLRDMGWSPIRLGAKEGLALLNGTQFSLAYALQGYLRGMRLYEMANLCAALSCEAFLCQPAPFDDRLHQLRPHPGQIRTADSIRRWLSGSPLAQTPRPAVQDPYAFRCTPQVHGASFDALTYIGQAVDTELNSVTDNPTLFPESDAILSGGNFHAQPLALPLDMLALALSELGSISERRVFQLLSGQRGLPPFLTPEAGLHSGLMIAQYTAAAIASQNKQFCTPASADSIVSSNGQEDHVSMAANAGVKAWKVVQNLERLLAIEFFTAAQALYFRQPNQTSPALQGILDSYRQMVPPVVEDRFLHADLELTCQFLEKLDLG